MATKVKSRTAKKSKPEKVKSPPARSKSATMTLEEALKALASLGTEAMRAYNARSGVGNSFGVKHGDIRVLARKIKADHQLAMSLWETGNIDAQYLAVLLIKPKDVSAKDVDRMVRSVTYAWVADWLTNYVVKQHESKETLRQEWMAADHRWAARAGWSLTAERVVKSPDGLDSAALLDRIESEMAGAEPEVQWTMNGTLAEIGVHFPKLRKRVISIGERIGLYRDWPVSKGCTIPYVPVWVEAMVKRQG
jgi:3-methyladenine DNA glycosylase AlkD